MHREEGEHHEQTQTRGPAADRCDGHRADLGGTAWGRMLAGTVPGARTIDRHGRCERNRDRRADGSLRGRVGAGRRGAW